MSLIAGVVLGFSWFAIAFFTVLNTWYLVLILLAGIGATDAARRGSFADHDKIFRSPLAPPVSIIVPAMDMERWIVGCVRGLLDLRYPEFEVIVVENGSTDGTFEVLRREFDLVPHPRLIEPRILVSCPVNSVHAPRGRENLLVIRKDSNGHPADAVNTGVNAARHPLVCRVDADSYLDEHALLAVVKPFIEDPQHIVGVGASIRPANGAEIKAGRVLTPHVGGRWVEAIQTVEYLRSFLLGRTAWSRLHAMLFISGAFGVFRRDIVTELGGWDRDGDGDDVEFLTRMHRRLRRAGQPYRIGFIPDPCCWTMVPESLADLRRQRRRWAHILAQSLRMHRVMIGNPRYGIIGLVVLPYFLIFELTSAAVELFALVTFAAGSALGIVSPVTVLLFAAVCIGYAILLSLLALFIEGLTYQRYRTAHDLALVALGAVAENVGFRQIHAWWRLRGIATAVSGRGTNWSHVAGEGQHAPTA